MAEGEGAPLWAAALFDKLEARIEKKIDDAVARLERSNDELKTRLGHVDLTVDSLKSSVSNNSRVVDALKSRVRDLEQKVTALEDYTRRDNVLIHNVKESAGETSESCLTMVRSIFGRMGVDGSDTIMVSACHRLGKFNRQSVTPRAIIVKFVSRFDRDRVCRRRNSCPDNLKITDDLSSTTQSRRRQMVPIYVRAKNNTKYAGKCKLVGDRLVINGTTFTIDNIGDLPPELAPSNYATKMNDKGDVTVFYGRFSPFSNFFPSPFIANDVQYHCLEQYFQHSKATACGDDVAAAKILGEEDPATIKRYGRSVRGTYEAHWETSADDAMKAGLLAKFTQNPSLGKKLVDTGSSLLGESSKFDSHWGTGLDIDDRNVFDASSWRGKNKMGQILMEVREVLRAAR